tara:strand:+ start:8595 stop:9932 length:1338 start_codon:yes stop_codon:yes gene_type:complete
MTVKYFGTDGIRGKSNQEPITAGTALRIGQAIGKYFSTNVGQQRVIIGKDTRLSGYMLEPALTAGFVSVGINVALVGPMPTPAVAALTKSMDFDIGLMISASHNLYQDNGIKIFGSDGFKLSDLVEGEIEILIDSVRSKSLASPDGLGKVSHLSGAADWYIDYVKNTFPEKQDLSGLKVVLDCANGAAYRVGPEILSQLGAKVISIGIDPNGYNINEGCGSTNLESLSKKVIEEKADVGIALDGDADRVVFCDEKGETIDGDQIMALIAQDWAKKDKIKGKTIVGTLMSNYGLEKYLSEIGLLLERSKVGDRYVVETMLHNGYNFGGEQSGHIILSDFSTTGDGLIAALQALSIINSSGKRVSNAAKVFMPVPQKLNNIKYKSPDLLTLDSVQSVIRSAEKRLDGKGRILVRKSGTEPLIRVMVESEDVSLMDSVMDEVLNILDG